MNDTDFKDKVFAPLATLNIELYNELDGKHIRTICNCEEPAQNSRFLTLDIEYSKFIHKDCEYEVKWCSEVHNGKQIALCRYISGTGTKVYRKGVITDVINSLEESLNKLYEISDKEHYADILRVKAHYQEILKKIDDKK